MKGPQIATPQNFFKPKPIEKRVFIGIEAGASSVSVVIEDEKAEKKVRTF